MNGRFSRLEVESAAPVQLEQPAKIGNAIRTSETDMQQAEEAYRNGRFEQALQMYTRALGKNQSLSVAWVGQVQMLVELGEYAEARLWGDKALELFRNHGDLLAAKARACLRQGDKAAAVESSDASVSSPGTSPLRWAARGEVLLSKNSARARDCFEKALADPAADWFDRVIIARVYIYHGKGVLAMEQAQAAVGLRPGHGYCWYVLGAGQELVGWAEQARVSFERALELSPDLVQAKQSIRELSSRSLAQRAKRRIGGLFKR